MLFIIKVIITESKMTIL